MNFPALPCVRRTAATLCLLAAAMAQAAPASYLKLTGIEGVHRADPYGGWSEVQGLNFRLTREARPVKGGDFFLGKPIIGAVGWTQPVDTTLPPLLSLMVQGKPIPEVRFQLVGDGPGGLATVAQLRLTNAALTELNLTGSQFSGALAVDGIGFGHKAFDDKGGLANARDTGYDFSEGEYRPDLSTPFEGYRYRPKAPPAGGTAAHDSIFVRHDSGFEAGASRIQGYENWSEVSGMSWKASASVNFGGGGGVDVGRAGAGELIWQQALDNAAYSGLDALLKGQKNDELVMEFVRHTKAGPVTFMQLVFKDFQFSTWALDDQSVQQGLSFSSMVQTVWAIEDTGLRGKATSIGWDVVENKLLGGVGPVDAPPGFGAGGLTGTVSAVPEPQSALLLAGGLLVVFLRQRRLLPAA